MLGLPGFRLAFAFSLPHGGAGLSPAPQSPAYLPLKTAKAADQDHAWHCDMKAKSELFPWLHTEGSAQEGLKREPSFREAPAFALGLFCLTLACGAGKREGPGVGIRSPKPPPAGHAFARIKELLGKLLCSNSNTGMTYLAGPQSTKVMHLMVGRFWPVIRPRHGPIPTLLQFVPSKHIQRGDLLNIQGTQQALNGGIIRVLTGPLKLVTPC